jgi:hypothetical protein
MTDRDSSTDRDHGSFKPALIIAIGILVIAITGVSVVLYNYEPGRGDVAPPAVQRPAGGNGPTAHAPAGDDAPARSGG